MNLLGVTEESQNQTQEIQPQQELQPVMSTLRESLSKHLSDDLVKMTRNRTEIRVSLTDKILFAEGSDKLHPAAYSLLTDMARILSDHPVKIQVEGHTDATGSSEKNWSLSALRAVAITTVLQERGGLDGRNLEVRGYGEFRPAAFDGTDIAWNRRVELVIQSTSPIAYDALNELEEVTGGFDGG